MADPYTLRILEIDGGGERGYLPLNFLKLFVDLWGINFTEIYKEFDVICGTSIGGILTTALAQGGISFETLSNFFTVQGPMIFTTDSDTPSEKVSTTEKLVDIAANTPFYGTSDDSYGSGLLYKTIRDVAGETKIKDLKTNVIIPSYRLDTNEFVLFSNIKREEFLGRNALASDVALSTSAAPFYLPYYTWGDGHTYIDGGLYQNNPAIFGRNLAQLIKPTARRACIFSLGTGIGTMGFAADTTAGRIKKYGKKPFFETYKRYINQFYKPKGKLNVNNLTVADDDLPSLSDMLTSNMLFSIASTGAQESIATSLLIESKYTINQIYYYRFQPLLDPSMDTELDTTDEETLQYYVDTANAWYDNDLDNIINFLGHLTA